MYRFKKIKDLSTEIPELKEVIELNKEAVESGYTEQILGTIRDTIMVICADSREREIALDPEYKFHIVGTAGNLVDLSQAPEVQNAIIIGHEDNKGEGCGAVTAAATYKGEKLPKGLQKIVETCEHTIRGNVEAISGRLKGKGISVAKGIYNHEMGGLEMVEVPAELETHADYMKAANAGYIKDHKPVTPTGDMAKGQNPYIAVLTKTDIPFGALIGGKDPKYQKPNSVFEVRMGTSPEVTLEELGSLQYVWSHALHGSGSFSVIDLDQGNFQDTYSIEAYSISSSDCKDIIAGNVDVDYWYKCNNNFEKTAVGGYSGGNSQTRDIEGGNFISGRPGFIAGHYYPSNDGVADYNGGVLSQSMITGTGGLNTVDVFPADINGDGRLDYVQGNYNDENFWYENRGIGSSFTQHDIYSGAGHSSRTNTVFAVDFDEDGDMDIVEGNDGRNYWYEQVYPDHFIEHELVGGNHDTGGLLVVDLQNDGSDLEVIVADNNGQLTIHTKYSGGYLTQIVDSNLGGEVIGLEVIDFDDDEDLDIIVGIEGEGDQGTGKLFLYEQNFPCTDWNLFFPGIPDPKNCEFDCEDFIWACDTSTFECTGEDSAGMNGPPDSVGDVLHTCRSVSGECKNNYVDGDDNVNYNGVDVNDIDSYTFLNSVCFNPTTPVPPLCGVFKGSYIVERGYCDESSGDIKALQIDSEFECVSDIENLFNTLLSTLSPGTSYLVPGFEYDMQSGPVYEGGFCLDYCMGYPGYVTEHEGCSVDGESIVGWDNDGCPTPINYSDYCEGTILKRVICDGQATNPPTPSAFAEGVDRTYTNEECYSDPITPSVCSDSCGTSSNIGYDTCYLGGGIGYCQPYAEFLDGGACLQTPNIPRDVDGSESYVVALNQDCDNQGGWSGIVEWANGGSIGVYGEYENPVKAVINRFTGGPNDYTQEVYDDRVGFETEACGDDMGEFYRTYVNGGLCCDESNDNILSNVLDDITDDYNMGGNYCVDYGVTSSAGCGNFRRDGSEECDALYSSELIRNYAFNEKTGEYVYQGFDPPNLVLVLGTDTNCDSDKFCSDSCACKTIDSITCGDNVVEGWEECDDGNTNNGDGCSFECFDECGDGTIDNDGNDGYTEVCDDDGDCGSGESCSNSCQVCEDDDVNNNNNNGNPPPGSTTYAQSIYGECVCNDPDGCPDGIGQVQVYHLTPGGSPSAPTYEECFLASEDVPFMSSFSILLTILLLVGFYLVNRRR